MLRTIVLCLAAVGQPSRSAEYTAAYARGREEAEYELVEGRATLYAYGILRDTLDRETGLPFVAIAGCDVDDSAAGRAAGHNRRIKEYIAAHGLAPGSYKSWEKELFDLRGFFAEADAAERSGPLRLDGPAATSSDGALSLGLRRIPAGRTSAPTIPSELVAASGGVERTISLPPLLAAAGRAEVAWGPEGSGLAVVRWGGLPPDAGADRVIAAVDVKTGRWLRQEFEHRKAPPAISPRR